MGRRRIFHRIQVTYKQDADNITEVVLSEVASGGVGSVVEYNSRRIRDWGLVLVYKLLPQILGFMVATLFPAVASALVIQLSIHIGMIHLGDIVMTSRKFRMYSHD